MPCDIVSHVCKYLRRDWWPDERFQCFSEECLENQANKFLQQKIIQQVTGKPTKSKRATRSFFECPGCSVASYCCNDHRQSDFKDGHKGFCGNPPYNIPGQKETELLSDVLRLQKNQSKSSVFNDQVNNLVVHMLDTTVDVEHAEDNDSGSWESMDTEEDEEEEQSESITNVVLRFFVRESYRALESREE
jgi:hypothetical protein